MPRTVIVSPHDNVVVREPLSHAERGRLGAKAKWKGHIPRVLDLHPLTADQRRLVLAMVDMARTTKKAGPADNGPASEVRRGDVERRSAA